MYLDYDEYVEMGGTLTEAEHKVWERRARGLIELATHGRVKGDDPVRDAVKEAMYDLIDVFYNENANSESIPVGINSMSNDGVSITYGNAQAITKQWDARKRDVLVLYLADETATIGNYTVPLLYGGVEFDGEEVS